MSLPRAPRFTTTHATAITLALTLGWLLVAIGSSAAPFDRGLRHSLVVWPTILLVLAWISRSTHGRHARATTAFSDLLVIGPAIFLAVLLHDRLGIPGTEQAAAALLYVATILLLWLRLPALVKLLRPHQRVPFHFAIVPLVLFTMLAPWSTSQRTPDGDEPWYLLVTHSLAYDLDTALDDNYARGDSLHFMDREIEPQPGDPLGADGRLRSRHGMLLPLVMTLPYRVFGLSGALALILVSSSLLAWLTLTLLHQLWPGRPAASVMTWLLMIGSSPLLLFSHQVWVEVPAAVLLLAGFLALRKLESGTGGRRTVALLVLCLIALPALKLRFAVVAVCLSLVCVLGLRQQRFSGRRLAAVGGSGLVMLGLLLIANQLRFGNPLRIYEWQQLVARPEQLGTVVEHFLGLFFDGAFGLFAYAPLWMLALPGILATVRRQPKLAGQLALLSFPYLLLVSSQGEWYGGWSPPFRYPLLLLPLIAILVAAGLADRHRAGPRTLIFGLSLATLALSSIWVAEPGWTYNLASGSSHAIDRLTWLSAVDWMRWWPSAARPSLAIWSVPAFLSALFLSVWWLPRRPPSLGVRPLPKALGAASGVAIFALMLTLGIDSAHRLPTHHVEAESAFVSKSGGHPEPLQWTFDRTRFREGWTLRHGEQLEIPVTPAGSLATVRMDLRFFRNRNEDLLVSAFADQRRIGGARLRRPDSWTPLVLGPVEWQEARSLRIVVEPPLGSGQPGLVNGVAVDAVDFIWSQGLSP